MKTLFSMLGIWFAAQIAAAQNNNLVIFSKDKHKFFLLVNGAQQNENPYANLKLEKINYQNVNVKVIFESGEIANIERVISFDLANKDHEYVYSIVPEKGKKGYMQLILAANRPLHKSKKESGQIVSTFKPGDEPVNPNSNPSVVNNPPVGNNSDTPPPLPNAGNGNNNGAGTNGNNNWGNSDPNNWGNNPNANSTITSNSSTTVSSSTNGQAPTTNTWGHNNSTVTNNGSTTVNNSTFGTPPPNYDPNASNADIQKMRADAQRQMDEARKEMERARQQAQAEMERARANRPSGFGDKNNSSSNPPAPVSTSPGMPDQSFQQLVADINSKSFSRDKVSAMEKGLSNQSLNMSQLKTLLGMLDFDNDKVKIATLGYQKCTDKDNYKMLQDSFSFDNSMRNFTQAIGR
jgi:hypothetical protein